MKQTTFVIIGLGLIGGSLAAAIRKKFPQGRVVGVSRKGRTIAFAKKKGFIHEGFTRLKLAVRAAKFVLVCSPIDSIPKLISEVDRFAPPGTVVTDVGSTKSEIVNWADRKRFRNIEFIGSHPLAGSHLTGIRHAKGDLFRGAFVFVTPSRKSSRRAFASASSFWKRLGANVRRVSPKVHDQIVSEVSHLPHAIASILMHIVSSNSFRYRAAGFSDTTRVAQGSPELWTPIMLTNRANVLRDLRRFERVLRRFRVLLGNRSKKSLYRFLRIAALRRSRSGSS
ncbi:MAG: prephenate dehydrogenase [Candidatus Omnitrophica bacterium]|nr:prephenate dehydrogenase [Candidatus Omnitrophota bacterium]